MRSSHVARPAAAPRAVPGRAVTGAHEHAARADRAARPDVVPAGRRRRTTARDRDRDRAAACRIMPGPGLRQSQSADSAAIGRVGMMRAVELAVDPRAAGAPAARRSRRARRATNGFVDEAAADARLVGGDDDDEAGAVEQADRVDASTGRAAGARAGRDSRVLDHRAVAIEEHRRPRSARRPGRSRRVHGVDDAVGGDALHAAVIDRTVAQHTGPAEDRLREHVRRSRRAAPSPARRSARRSRRPARPAPRRGASRRSRSTRTRRTAPSRRPARRRVVRPTRSTTRRAPRGSADSIARAASRSCRAPPTSTHVDAVLARPAAATTRRRDPAATAWPARTRRPARTPTIGAGAVPAARGEQRVALGARGRGARASSRLRAGRRRCRARGRARW